MQEAHRLLTVRFEEAYDEFLEPIYRYFLYRFNDRDRAKDLAQETFMRAWDYARSGKKIKLMKPFLYTTASNLFKNELRRKRETASLEVLQEGGFEIADEAVPAEELAEAKRLMTKLPQLPDRYHEVLTLRFVDGLSPQEIGEVLGERSTTVSVRIHRALRKLRDLHETT